MFSTGLFHVIMIYVTSECLIQFPSLKIISFKSHTSTGVEKIQYRLTGSSIHYTKIIKYIFLLGMNTANGVYNSTAVSEEIIKLTL